MPENVSPLQAFDLYFTVCWLLKQLRNHKYFEELYGKMKSNVYLYNAKDTVIYINC